MSITMKELEDFFSAYAKALSARDSQAIVQCWGVPTLILSDEGVIAAVKLEEVDAFFSSSMKQYEKVASAHPTIKSAMLLSDNVASCQVVWDHHDKSGKSVGGEIGHYMLKRDGTALHIHVYTPLMAK
jgi:hypothetical protein